MLDDILKGQEKSQLVLLADTVDCCGRLLLLNASLKCLHRDCHLIIVCSERPPKFFENWLPRTLHGRLKCVSRLNKDSEDDFNRVISCAISESAQPAVVLFDSLSPLLLTQDTSDVCRFLHTLKSDANVSQVIALFHRDVHDDSIYSLLKHMAGTVVELRPGSTEDYVCHIRQCRPTGKVLKSSESVFLDDNLCIQKIQPVKVKGRTDVPGDSQPPPSDPTSRLTFNLSLTDSEKEARSQVVLPYTKERSAGEQGVAQFGGRIHYEPDEDDDLDEEDPDDDLNI